MARRYHGFFTMEVLVGMMLLTALAASLAVTLFARQKVADRMDAKSRAIDLAEAGLIAVRANRPVPSGVTIRRSSAGNHGEWIYARATVAQDSAELITLLPQGGPQ